MSISVQCSACNVTMTAPEALAGQQRPCPKCKRPCLIPDALDPVEVEPNVNPLADLVPAPTPTASKPSKRKRARDEDDQDEDNRGEVDRPRWQPGDVNLGVVRVAAWVFLVLVVVEKIPTFIIKDAHPRCAVAVTPASGSSAPAAASDSKC